MKVTTGFLGPAGTWQVTKVLVYWGLSKLPVC